MLKKYLTLFILFSGLSVFGAENYLNSVIIENIDGKDNIILRSDSISKIKREIEGSDKVILTLKNIRQSDTINTLYKNKSNVDGLIVQNDGNEIKIFIKAPEISKANIVFETPDSAPITVEDNKSGSLIIWSIISILTLLAIMRSAKNIVLEPSNVDINSKIKEREKELYKNYQKEISTLPSMNYKLNIYSKHVLKGETIRSYESRYSKV